MSRTEVVMLQKYWISPKGTGGSERIADRVSGSLAEYGIPTAIMTCGEFVRGVEAPHDFSYSEPVFGNEMRPVHEIPSIPQITEYVCRHCRNASIIQIGWGYEHYPDELKKILKLPMPKVFVMLETGHFDQMTQNFISPEGKEEYMELLRRSFDAVVAISRPLQNEAQGLGFNNVELIYGPVPNCFHPVSAEEKTRIRQEMELPEGRTIYLYAGRLVAEKGVDHITEAWRLLSPDVRDKSALVLVGGFSSEDGTLMDDIDQLQSDYPDSVRLFGSVNDEKRLGKIFSAADVFLYPTRHQEGLAMAPAEAMSSGLPLITTRYAALHTGMSDLAIPDQTSLVYTTEEGPRGFADKLTLFQDRQLRAEYGKRSIDQIQRLGMSPESVAKKYADLYQRLLDKSTYDAPLAR